MNLQGKKKGVPHDTEGTERGAGWGWEKGRTGLHWKGFGEPEVTEGPYLPPR